MQKVVFTIVIFGAMLIPFFIHYIAKYAFDGYTTKDVVERLLATHLGTDYKDRVMQEKTALDIKIATLELFNKSNNIASEAEKNLLYQQCAVMKEYSAILGKRIDSF